MSSGLGRILGLRAQLPRRTIAQWQRPCRKQISTKATTPKSTGWQSHSSQKLLLAIATTAIVVTSGFACASLMSPVRLDTHDGFPEKPILDRSRLPEIRYATIKEMEEVIMQDGGNELSLRLCEQLGADLPTFLGPRRDPPRTQRYREHHLHGPSRPQGTRLLGMVLHQRRCPSSRSRVSSQH